MTIWNLGSINIDHFYRMARLPGPGETVAADAVTVGLGGKGANQSVAAARAGSTVRHIGAIGADGAWARDRIAQYGVDVTHVAVADGPTGHAIINVDADGENAIVILPGANRMQSRAAMAQALSGSAAGDILLLQNETNLQREAAGFAADRGMRVIYSAAPFEIAAVRGVMDQADILVMNEVEARQLRDATGLTPAELPVGAMLVTRGARGAIYHDLRKGREIRADAFAVKPVDTTGAGDTFTGYFAAGLDQGMEIRAALRLASAAAACKVTRVGTADAIPARAEVDAFLAARR